MEIVLLEAVIQGISYLVIIIHQEMKCISQNSLFGNNSDYLFGKNSLNNNGNNSGFFGNSNNN